jgi:hypothetical protein
MSVAGVWDRPSRVRLLTGTTCPSSVIRHAGRIIDPDSSLFTCSIMCPGRSCLRAAYPGSVHPGCDREKCRALGEGGERLVGWSGR